MSKVIEIRNRATGELAQSLDVTGYSAHNIGRLWDGLVHKINFEIWEPVYLPPRGDDQTLGEWVAA